MEGVDVLANIERDSWPRELWWCENPNCNEPTCEDPCQFCGDPVTRYKVVREADHRGAVETLRSLRAAWDQHMATCPQHAQVKVPTFEEIEAWRNAPSNTAAGGGEE